MLPPPGGCKFCFQPAARLAVPGHESFQQVGLPITNKLIDYSFRPFDSQPVCKSAVKPCVSNVGPNVYGLRRSPEKPIFQFAEHPI